MGLLNSSSCTTFVPKWRNLRVGVCLTAFVALAGCASYPRLNAVTERHEPTTAHESLAQRMRDELARENGQSINELTPVGGNTSATVAPAQPAATPEQIASVVPDQQVQVSLPPQAVPQFIDTAFGQILHVPYYTGPGVAQRRDFVTMRTPVTMNSRQFFSMVQATLSQYGLAVLVEGGAVRIVQDDVLSGQAPSFVRTRSLPDAPASSRPVVQFFQLSALDIDAVMPLLETVYPNRGSVRITPQADTNTLMLVGSSRDVAALGDLLNQIDRPRYADAHVASIKPTYMSSEQLADNLSRALSAEGYQVSNTVENRARGITFVPLATAGQLLVFASDPALFNRALYWAQQLDTPAALGNSDGVFVYTAVNTTAEDLGALVAQVGGSDSGGGANTGVNPPEVAVRRVNGVRTGGDRPDVQGPRATTSGPFTIDPAGNRILYHGTAAEYAHVLSLLQQLDTPPQQVLIELTVAEVTLTDDTRYGVEWFIDSATNNGTLTGGTPGSAIAPPIGGLVASATHIYSRGTVTAALSAFASNNNLNILSTPRLVTRSGNEAQILIGDDIPIITSQRAANQQTGGDTDVLQTVQYRQTGVILNVRPVVYGDNRVDIQLYQEVSNQSDSDTNAAIASPAISNRSVTTQLALQEGQTAVIGGMIQDNYQRSQTGVPGLKDIPLLGAAFRHDRVTGTKTELVLLVTPYIIHDNEEMSDLADGASRVINRDLRTRGPQVYTLYPWRVPFVGGHDHVLVPHEALRTPSLLHVAPTPAISTAAPAATSIQSQDPPEAPAQTPQPAAPQPSTAAPAPNPAHAQEPAQIAEPQANPGH